MRAPDADLLPEVKRIGVVGHPRYDPFRSVVQRVVEFARARDLELVFEDPILEMHPELAGSRCLTPEVAHELDLLLTLGGDGTLLRGARLVAQDAVPVLGINLGHLGFLTSAAPEETEAALDRVLRGEVWLDVRSVLLVTAEGEDGTGRGTYLALNDAVLHKAGGARVIRLLVSARGEEVGTYSADGIIVSTPTGSTAYSLSAGGPIVSPSVDCMIATPICPHTLGVRPLVLPGDETITLEVLSPTEELVLTIDGQESARLAPGARVVVRRAPDPVWLVRFPGQTFFSTVRRKLRWGDLTEREGRW